jgi:hypothetical protein
LDKFPCAAEKLHVIEIKLYVAFVPLKRLCTLEIPALANSVLYIPERHVICEEAGQVEAVLRPPYGQPQALQVGHGPKCPLLNIQTKIYSKCALNKKIFRTLNFKGSYTQLGQ